MVIKVTQYWDRHFASSSPGSEIWWRNVDVSKTFGGLDSEPESCPVRLAEPRDCEGRCWSETSKLERSPYTIEVFVLSNGN